MKDDLKKRVCRVCREEKFLKSFPRISNGKYRERQCYSCRNKKKKEAGKCSVCYNKIASGKTYCEVHLEAQRASARSRNLRYRLQALNYYCNNLPKCQCSGCDETQIEFLTIDHIGGGGNKHRREIKRNQSSKRINPSGSIYRWLKKHNYPDGFRVLCYNCNCVRGVYGYCPHETQQANEQEFKTIVREICEVNDDGEIVLKGGAKEVMIIRQQI